VNHLRLGSICTLGLLAAVCGLSSGCGTSKYVEFRDASRGIAFRYPASWFVTGFSMTNSPSRLVVASYHVALAQVEGDCGGIEALGKLPPGGAAVLIIDYGSGAPLAGFSPQPQRFQLRNGTYANYECFGRSYLFRFRSAGQDIQAHVVLGRSAGTGRRSDALSILDSFSQSKP
jgi:hypothetical protein